METHLLRYIFPGMIEAPETPEALLDCFERNLAIRGVRPRYGHTYDTVFDLLLRFGGLRPPMRESQQLLRLSDLELFLEYPSPAPPLHPNGTYDPKPEAAEAARQLFEKAKDQGYRDGGPEGPVVKPWQAFIDQGKAALRHFCRVYPEAHWLPDRTGWGDVLRGCLEAIDRRVSRDVDAKRIRAVAAALRHEPDPRWGSADVPRGLLQGFSQLLDALEKSTDVPDPASWWEKNEPRIPDPQALGLEPPVPRPFRETR